MYEDLRKKLHEKLLEALLTDNHDVLDDLADEVTELAIRIACEEVTKNAARLREAATAAPRDTIKERMMHAAETLEQAAAVIMAKGEATVYGQDEHL